MLKFGTDGVRGVANTELTPELALALGRASARVLAGGALGQVVIGCDTRRSASLLEAALSAGFASEGVDAVSLGVVPTPMVAHASAVLGVPGAMISASHNPFADNGIKLFAPGDESWPTTSRPGSKRCCPPSSTARLRANAPPEPGSA